MLWFEKNYITRYNYAYYLILETLPPKLQVLSNLAFANTTFGNNNITVSSLPDTLTLLGSFAFNNCPRVRFTTIHENIILQNYALSNCGRYYQNTEYEVNVYIGAHTEEEAKNRIGEDAFDGYLGGTGNSKLKYLFPNMNSLDIVALGLCGYWGIGEQQVSSQVAL